MSDIGISPCSVLTDRQRIILESHFFNPFYTGPAFSESQFRREEKVHELTFIVCALLGAGLKKNKSRE